MTPAPTASPAAGPRWHAAATRGLRLAGGLLAGLVLAGCASTGGFTLHDVGHIDPQQPDRVASAGAEHLRQGLRIHRAGQPLPVSVGMALAEGDQVESLEATLVVLRFPDGHEAVLLPHTRVRLGSLIADFGEVFVRVFRQVQGQFKVKTQYVTAGVEGTSFWVRVGRDQRLSLGVLDGRVSLSSVGDRWAPVPVLPDEVATVEGTAAPNKRGQPRDQVDAIVRLVRGGWRPAPPPPPPGR